MLATMILRNKYIKERKYQNMAMLYTKNGHSMYDMVSLLQKAIRRGDAEVAGYAANELRGRYNAYLWRRLLAYYIGGMMNGNKRN